MIQVLARLPLRRSLAWWLSASCLTAPPLYLDHACLTILSPYSQQVSLRHDHLTLIALIYLSIDDETVVVLRCWMGYAMLQARRSRPRQCPLLNMRSCSFQLEFPAEKLIFKSQYVQGLFSMWAKRHPLNTRAYCRLPTECVLNRHFCAIKHVSAVLVPACFVTTFNPSQCWGIHWISSVNSIKIQANKGPQTNTSAATCWRVPIRTFFWGNVASKLAKFRWASWSPSTSSSAQHGIIQQLDKQEAIWFLGIWQDFPTSKDYHTPWSVHEAYSPLRKCKIHGMYDIVISFVGVWRSVWSSLMQSFML